jgi:hypothetical protein
MTDDPAMVDGAARLMIARHGVNAFAHAEMRARTLRAAGELRAALTWRMVMRRIADFTRDRRAAA